MRVFIALLCGLFIFPSLVSAAEIKTDIKATYSFSDDGSAKVIQHISLQNLSSKFYPTSYEMVIQGEQIDQITVSDADGSIKNEIRDGGNKTTILTVQFDKPIVGKGKVREFTVSYVSQAATRRGQVWEISLPRLANSEFSDNYELRIEIPKNYGHLAFIAPTPNKIEGEVYTFDKSQLVESGVVAAFGNFQTFSFKLKYHLENPKNTQASGVITLPSDTPYQKIYFDQLNPQPVNVHADIDGNWLATYLLDPKQKLDIEAIGQAHILSSPTLPIHSPSEASLSEYVSSQKYWEVNDSTIRALAADLKTPQAIYNFVIKTLKYDFTRLENREGERKGAVKALDSPASSVCTEFTDLFIALSRAAGIPAREVNGYVFTNDPQKNPSQMGLNSLHSWAEYWDTERKTWISVDPTWGSTSGADYFSSFDLNHFAFVVHGEDSERPVSVEKYEISQAEYKDYPLTALSVEWMKPFQFTPFVANTSELKVSNSQGQAVYYTPVSVSATGLPSSSSSRFSIPTLPPYSHVTVPVNFSSTIWAPITTKYLTVAVSGRTITYNIPNTLFVFWHVTIALIASGLIIGLAAAAYYSWSLYLQRRHRSDSVRR